MSANETMNVSSTGGQKAGNLERYDLIPAEPLRRLAIHAGRPEVGRSGSFNWAMKWAWDFWSDEYSEDGEFHPLIAAAWEAFWIVESESRIIELNVPPRGPSIREYYDRLPVEALRQLAHHFGVGALKYDDDNWRRGYDWRLSFAAANRHAWQWFAGETHDPETGSHHLIAFAWHMLVLDEFTRIHPEFDTRPGVHADHVHGAVPERKPRVVGQLGDSERDAQWIDRDGDQWRWSARHGGWQCNDEGGRINECAAVGPSSFAPYTEIIEDTISSTEQ